MKRLAEWIEGVVRRMEADNAARRERIFRKRFPPELEIKPPEVRGWRRAAAHRSRSQVRS